MKLALIILAIASGFELLLWLPGVWRWRKPIACVLIITLAVASGLLVGSQVATWTILVGILSLYRLINLLRLVEGRTQADYLFQVARASTLWLVGLQVVIVVVAGLNSHYHVHAAIWWYVLAEAQLLVGGILITSTNRHLRTTRPLTLSDSYADRDLPTLTVAIPARNETDDLEACLQSLIANTYPKLEILVLDDCSQERRTPEIIRGFAHDGVRFIAGKVPPEHWLAKNYAYQQLASEANGELLLFCGVDTRFAPESLRTLVITLLEKKKTMLSVIPRNQLPKRSSLESLLVQSSRYAWELALPRRWLNRPPVLSTCWLITAAALHAAGSFKAVSNSSSPESYLARFASRTNDGYSFMQSNTAIDLLCVKSFNEQRATATRTRYPQLHRRPELVGVLGLLEVAMLVAPFGLLVGSIIGHHWLLVAVSSLSAVLVTAMYARIMALTYRQALVRGLWLLPFAAIYDIGLLNYSMWQYEFREVIWKDRNICVPLMRALPSLPKS